MGGLKFRPHRHKPYSVVHSSRTFVEMLKGPVQITDMKQAQQFIIKEGDSNSGEID